MVWYSFSDYDDSSDSESDDHELFSRSQTSLTSQSQTSLTSQSQTSLTSQTSITSSASESVHSEPSRGEVTSGGGDPVDETDLPSVMLNRSVSEQRPLVKKRDYWQPKNLIKSHKLKLQVLPCVCQYARTVYTCTYFVSMK